MAKPSPRSQRSIRIPIGLIPKFTVTAQKHVQLLNLEPLSMGFMQANLMATDQELFELGIGMARPDHH